ncbi:MAG TPA: hypothetical protein DCG75_00595 [Bacteroidales bacterium]|nr:hypothetical protein [Bacteroidales bacterium]
MKSIKIFFAIAISISSFVAYAQDCTDYHVNNCRWADESFFFSRQSRSALFTQGMSSEFSITVYGDEEYYISVQGDKKLGKIKIRVKEDNPKKIVLYDNSNYKFENYLYFKNENTRNLIIEITSDAEKKFSSSAERFCLGVLIEFRTFDTKNTKTGFE